MTPEERAHLLRTKGPAYVARIERDMGLGDWGPMVAPPRAADLAFIEARASSFRALGMDALADELDVVVEELHYHRARA
jgi:hypothetical protein